MTLASTAKPSPFTRPASMQARTTASNTCRGVSLARKRRWQLTEKVNGHSAFDRGDERLACKPLEGVDGSLRGLANLDEVAVRITHVAAQFMAVIIEGLGEEPSALLGPLFIACVNVCDAPIEEAAHPIQISGWREPYIGLVRRRTSAGIEDDPGILQLDVAGIFLLHDFSAQA